MSLFPCSPLPSLCILNLNDALKTRIENMYLILICIYTIFREVETFFLCLLTIWIFFFYRGFSFFFFLIFILFFSLFFKFYFIFKLYNIVLVLPNIEMNLPQVYMCSPSWTLLPPPSPYHPSGSSQCTSPLAVFVACLLIQKYLFPLHKQ